MRGQRKVMTLVVEVQMTSDGFVARVAGPEDLVTDMWTYPETTPGRALRAIGSDVDQDMASAGWRHAAEGNDLRASDDPGDDDDGDEVPGA